MRVKTLPRHLPRRNLTQLKSVSSSGSEVVSPKKCENIGSSFIKTVNFTTFGDIVDQVDLRTGDTTVPQQDEEASSRETSGEWESSGAEQEKSGGEAALDLSTRNAADSPTRSDQFKDTYLYQLMTDPQLFKQLAGEGSQASKASCCCPYCKKEFASEAEVKAHLNVSADEHNQLMCCACGKCFAQKRYLRYHQRSHSERSKYACDICTRKYSRLDNLTRHNIFHTNPDKFPCNSCERTFARKDLLNKHLKCHENKYKYHCDVCQKYFKGPVSLENHTKLFHANSQPNGGMHSSAPSPQCY